MVWGPMVYGITLVTELIHIFCSETNEMTILQDRLPILPHLFLLVCITLYLRYCIHNTVSTKMSL